MKTKAIVISLTAGPLIAGLVLTGCTDPAAARHEVGCVAGTMGGAVIGGAIGSRFGGGSGQSLMTGAGAITGAMTSARALEC
jgi:outer membrane lipoprotein SlyB